MQQLERDLMSSAVLCRSARRHLGLVQEGMVVGSLHVLAHLKRKAALAQLIDHLRALRALAEDCVTVQAQDPSPSPSRSRSRSPSPNRNPNRNPNPKLTLTLTLTA